jgi:copper oxidase (laccase) domain-containing protein
MVAAMQALGARADRIRVALGPSIGSCCFEVGPEVVAAFRDALGDVPGLVVAGPHKDHFRDALGDVPGLVVAGPHKDHVDLRVATRAILERAGVAPDHIDDRPPCTRCEPERFFSYRRDGRAGGIHMSFIGLV